MHIYRGERGFYCFVCHTGGDVIEFTQRYFGIPFIDAEKKLNDDFSLHLPIGEQLDSEARRKAEQKSRERRRQIQERKKQKERLVNAYHAALDAWIELDKVIIQFAPERNYGIITDAYADAIKKIDAAEYALDVAERKLKEFDMNNNGAAS